MPIRLWIAFGGGAESWAAQLAQYDLWLVMQGAGTIKPQVSAFA
jgi:plasmid maintenance system antidote protein VapI